MSAPVMNNRGSKSPLRTAGDHDTPVKHPETGRPLSEVDRAGGAVPHETRHPTRVSDRQRAAQRFRVALGCFVVLVFAGFGLAGAATGDYVTAAILLPFAWLAGYMTWLRVTSEQPVSLLPSLVIALGGRRLFANRRRE